MPIVQALACVCKLGYYGETEINSGLILMHPTLRRIKNEIRFWRRQCSPNPMVRAYARWKRDRGDATLRLDYPLNASSIVFDVGGYQGDWAAEIHARYGCAVYIFEPVPDFTAVLAARFAGNDRIRIFPFGLADADGLLDLSADANASSVYKQGETMLRVPLRAAADFIAAEGISRIDLMKINIEGGEFPLLEHLIATGLVDRIGDLQIQFHDFYPDAARLRTELQDRLRQTHDQTYDYTFIWENWRRKVPLTVPLKSGSIRTETDHAPASSAASHG